MLGQVSCQTPVSVYSQTCIAGGDSYFLYCDAMHQTPTKQFFKCVPGADMSINNNGRVYGVGNFQCNPNVGGGGKANACQNPQRILVKEAVYDFLN